MDGRDYQDLLRPLVEGRRVVLAGGPAAVHTSTAELLHRLGADSILIVGTDGRGIGPLPEPAVATWTATATATRSMSQSIHAANRVLRDPPAEVRAAVEAFDPGGDALVIGSFLNESPDLLGRAFLAHRRPEWVAYEDKTRADELWDAAAVARAPSAVVPLEQRALERAARALDGGSGTVWAADASAGWTGGAEGLRRVRGRADIGEAIEAFAPRAERVRIMPFVEGVPCSIHGIVFADHVATVRPVEQVTLRPVGAPTFFYAGCATFYDPPAGATATMRDAARRVGTCLRERLQYRGAFTIDGIVSSDGFVPTELNPRSGAGLNLMVRAQPDLPLQLLLDALVGGYALPYDPIELEQTLTAGADAHRAGGTWHPLAVPVEAVDQRSVVGNERGWRWAVDGEAASGEVVAGNHSSGSFVRLTAAATETPAGPPFAPRAAAFWAFADRELGTGVGPLEAATAEG